MIALTTLTVVAMGAQVSTAGDNERVAKLVMQLGADSFRVREAAADRLYTIGQTALPQLRMAARTNNDLEIRKRAEQLVRMIIDATARSKSLGIRLAYVEAGEFLMGSSHKEKDRRDDETQHAIRITRPFLIGTREVTQDEYGRVLDARPSWFSPTGGGRDKVKRVKTGTLPVDSVTWFDAIEFCNRLSKLDGHAPYYSVTDVKRDEKSITSANVSIIGGTGYRLPTEAEWEFACRAGTITPYHFGNARGGGNFKYTGSSANYGRVYHSRRRTTKVGRYKPNAWGIYDMHGNVAEWCWDWYDKAYYATSPAKDPPGTASGDHRVLRGGSFLVNQSSCRSATRFWTAPGERKYYIGFRIARTPTNAMIAEPSGDRTAAVGDNRWGNLRTDGAPTALTHARAMGGISPKTHDSLLQSVSIYIPQNKNASARVAVYIGGSLPDGPHAKAPARLLFDFGETPKGRSGWVTLAHPTGIRIPANTPIWLAWKGNTTDASVMYQERPVYTDSFQATRGRWDSKAIDIAADTPWPQTWPKKDGGGFEQARYACFLKLSPWK